MLQKEVFMSGQSPKLLQSPAFDRARDRTKVPSPAVNSELTTMNDVLQVSKPERTPGTAQPTPQWRQPEGPPGEPSEPKLPGPAPVPQPVPGPIDPGMPRPAA